MTLHDWVLLVLRTALFVMVVHIALLDWLTKSEDTMPVVVTGAIEHFDLRTAPPDGYVNIKRLSHGEKMQRRQFTSKMAMEASKGSKNVKTEVDLFNAEVTYFDWAHAIVDHNLQDKDGRPLDFRNRDDVKKVDGNVAEEVDTYIDKVNNFEEDEDTGKSPGTSEPLSSLTDPSQPQTNSASPPQSS